MKMLDKRGDEEGGSYAGARKSDGTSAAAPQTEDDEEVPF